MDWKNVFISRLLGLITLTGLTLAQEVIFRPDVTDIVKFANESSFFISCSGKNAMRIIWTKPSGEQVSSDRNQRIHTEESSGGKGVDLIYENIKRKDTGEYVCSVTINGRDVQRSFRLVVHKPISFGNTPVVQSATEGLDYLVRCDVRGDPEPMVTWKVNGSKIRQRGKKYEVRDRGLLVRNVTRGDAGEYLCKALQVADQTSDWKELFITVKVQHKPEWNNGHMEQAYSYVTGTVNLTCEAIAEPGAKFEWIKDNETVDENKENINIVNDVHKSVLQITVTDSSVFGSYVCKATNELGTLERAIVLEKGSKPGVPSFKVTSTGSATMTLSIDDPNTDVLGIVGYKVQYKMAKQDWSKAQEQDFPKGSKYQVMNLEHDTTYNVRVAAQNAAGFGDFAPEVEQKTQKLHTGGSAPQNQYWGVAILIQLCSILAAFLTL